jgi:hypothetical protein
MAPGGLDCCRPDWASSASTVAACLSICAEAGVDVSMDVSAHKPPQKGGLVCSSQQRVSGLLDHDRPDRCRHRRVAALRISQLYEPPVSSVTTTRRSPTLSPSVEHRPTPPVERQPTHFPFEALDSAWFPWVWMALWAAEQAGHALVSWHFVATGAALLSSDGPGAGLHLYATHPELQIGPLTFLTAAPLSGLPAWLSGSVAAVVIAATGPAMLLSLSHSAASHHHRQAAWPGSGGSAAALGRARSPLHPPGRRAGPGPACGGNARGSSLSDHPGSLAVGCIG